MQSKPLAKEHVGAPASLGVRVFGPDTAIAPGDLDRLLGAAPPSPARRQRLQTRPKFVVLAGDRIVGVVGYEVLGHEIRVYEFGIDAAAPCGPRCIAAAALDALELACLAAGVRRLVMTARARDAGPMLWQRGFSRIDQQSAGSWLHKVYW